MCKATPVLKLANDEKRFNVRLGLLIDYQNKDQKLLMTVILPAASLVTETYHSKLQEFIKNHLK